MNMTFDDDFTLGFTSPLGGWGSPGFNPNNNNQPTYGGGGNNNNWNWQQIVNQGFGLASQIFAGRGRYQTQQIGPDGRPVGQGYSPGAYQQQQDPYAGLTPAQREEMFRRQGGLAEDAFSGITGFISRNPLPIAAGLLGVYLLMREPPRSRR